MTSGLLDSLFHKVIQGAKGPTVFFVFLICLLFSTTESLMLSHEYCWSRKSQRGGNTESPTVTLITVDLSHTTMFRYKEGWKQNYLLAIYSAKTLSRRNSRKRGNGHCGQLVVSTYKISWALSLPRWSTISATIPGSWMDSKRLPSLLCVVRQAPTITQGRL